MVSQIGNLKLLKVIIDDWQCADQEGIELNGLELALWTVNNGFELSKHQVNNDRRVSLQVVLPSFLCDIEIWPSIVILGFDVWLDLDSIEIFMDTVQQI